MIATETYNDACRRVHQELAGSPTGAIFCALASARDRFLDALAEREPLGAALPERWIIQESHSGQRRPIMLLDGSWVYKPRSLHADVAWQHLTAWYADRVGLTISLPFALETGEGHGWQQRVYHKAAEPSEIDIFYERLGMLGALAWVLGSTDMTGSNMVAAGALPTIIDAETALMPADLEFDGSLAVQFRRGGIAPFSAVDPYGRWLSHGAARLGGAPCLHSPESANRDCAFCENLPLDPQGLGHPVESHGYALEKGFAVGLRVLLAARSDLLSLSSPLQAFEYARGRIVLRPTAGYTLVRAWYFAALHRSGEAADVAALLRKMPVKHRLNATARDALIALEVEALRLGDLPRFEMAMSSRTLLLGEQSLDLQYSGIERACRRIAALDASLVESACRAWSRSVRGQVRAVLA